MQHKALEKKSNIEYLEQVGWQQFLPKFVIEGIPVCFVITFTVWFSCMGVIECICYILSGKKLPLNFCL